MDTHIKPPIIVVCDDTYVFETLSAAEDYIEPVDADDCTAAYDSEGRSLRLLGTLYWEQSRDQSSAHNKPSTLKERLAQFLKGAYEAPPWTKIVPAEADPTHADEAASALRNLLISVNEPSGKKWPGLGLSPEWLATASLQELTEYVRSRGVYFP